MASSELRVLWIDTDAMRVGGVVTIEPRRDLPDGATVASLVDTLNAKLLQLVPPASQTVRRVSSILLNGTPLQHTRLLDELVLEMSTSTRPRLVATTRPCAHVRRVHACASEDDRVWIETLTGKRFSVRCTLHGLVSDVMEKITNLEGIPKDVQRLIFAGKQLEGDRTLADYEVAAEATIRLVQRNRGGGWCPQPFVDVSDDSIVVPTQYSDYLPTWRRCGKGLNIEGYCNRRSCRAYGKVVIHRNGWHSFNLIRDTNVACPLCNSKIQPLTCGFYNCTWKFEGVQSCGRLKGSVWKEAYGQKYHRFRLDAKGGTVSWESLLIVVKARKEAAPAKTVQPLVDSAVKPDDVCAICRAEFGFATQDDGVRWNDEDDRASRSISSRDFRTSRSISSRIFGWFGSFFSTGAARDYDTDTAATHELVTSETISTTHCGHSFHTDCLNEWSTWSLCKVAQTTCPICRERL